MGYRAYTTHMEFEYQEAENVHYKENGIELVELPKAAITNETSGPTVAFIPYQNLLSLEPMEDDDDKT